jgi:hypothetical protein
MENNPFFTDDDGEFEENNNNGQNEFTFSFAEVGRLEANKVQQSLLSIYERLYKEKKPEEENEVNLNKENEEEDIYQRYASVGYSAHIDCVTDNEISKWQKVFPYLMIEGKAAIIHPQPDIPVIEDNVINNINNNNEMEYSKSEKISNSPNNDIFIEPDPIISNLSSSSSHLSSPNSMKVDDSNPPASLICDLWVIGKSIVKQSNEICIDENEIYDEDVTTVDGILDEMIFEYYDDDTVDGNISDDEDDNINTNHGDPPIEPEGSKKYELMSIIRDGVWSDVVNDLRPFVSKLVKESNKAGLKYNDNEIEVDNTSSHDTESFVNSNNDDNSGYES